MSSPSVLTRLAPAKVNFFLHVGPVKPNGRHDLDSLVGFADAAAADRLSVSPAGTLALSLTGPGAAGLVAGEDNLVLAAARLLAEAAGIAAGAQLTLDKQLPVAAGIGGGSADAAAALGLLTDLWDIDPAIAARLAPGLGGDVPVALAGRWAMMRGEGERVATLAGALSLPAVLVNPGVSCPTGQVFAAYDAAGGGQGFAERQDVPPLDAAALLGWLSATRNDLEGPAMGLVPEIGLVLTALEGTPGARLSRMSGSGATCFALYDTSAAAQAAADELSLAHPGWWVRACRIGNAPA